MSDWASFASGFATAATIVFTIATIKALFRLRRRRKLQRIEHEWRTILSTIERLENRR